MANEIKYVSLSNLDYYDGKIKEHIADADTALKENLEGQITVVANALDGEITRAKAAEATNAAAAEAAQTTANQNAEDITTLENYVGTFTASEGVDTVVKYIDAKTANIASDEALGALATRVGQAETDIDNIEKDYLKTADKTELLDAIGAEKTRAEGIESGLRADVDAIKGDYLKTNDKTGLQSNIDVVSDKVDILIGTDANKSVRTIANEELAKQLIAEDADASLDTLTEIAAWIQSHPDDAAAMNAAITALQNKVDTGDKTVSTYVTDAINALQIGDYAKAADLTALAERVSALETASATHALKTEVEAVSDALEEYKDAHTNDYTNAQIDAAIKVNTDAIAALGDTYATDAELATAIESEVTRANGAYAAKSLETTVSEHKADTVAHTTSTEKALWNAALQSSDIATGATNGTIAVKGADVAVKGLGSAAYTEASAYDSSGSAAAVQTKLNEEIVRAKAAEEANAAAIGAFVECSEDDINSLFA